MTALRQAGIVAANFVLALDGNSGLRDGKEWGFMNYGFEIPVAQGLSAINPVEELNTHEGSYIYRFNITPNFWAAGKQWRPIPVALSLADEGDGVYLVAANDEGPIEITVQRDAIGNFNPVKLQASLYPLADALVRSIWSNIATAREISDTDELIKHSSDQFSRGEKDKLMHKANLLRSTIEEAV